MKTAEGQVSASGAPATAENPWVGPRPFEEAEQARYFGRELEARDLLALVIRERLVLFFAQSGAGKSSLLRARLIPDLRGQGFDVLPIGRVNDAMPEGVDPASVPNVFVYQLLLSLNAKLPADQQAPPDALVNVSLFEFLGGQDGETLETGEELAPTVLLIDQFEEIFTAYPGRWEDRAGFFAQLNECLERLPKLWVVLCLREDYLAPLEPHAERMTNRLRARFYMERMGYEAALKAVREPAALFNRPFSPGVAEQLVDDLRQVHVLGQQQTVADQYVQPVQLQVVCLRLWEKLPAGGGEITAADLAAAGDVDQALMGFYEDKLHEVLAHPDVIAAGVTERILRTWFQRELITETGIRSTVWRNDAAGLTGSLPNVAVDHLAAAYLLRSEPRAGGTWVELAHDRLVDPIRESNDAWLKKNQSALERQAAIWRDEGKPPDRLLLVGDDLVEAENWAAQHEAELEPHEKELLAVSKAAQDATQKKLEGEREAARQRELEQAQRLAEEQRLRADEQTMASGRLRRRALIAASLAMAAVVLGLAAGWLGFQSHTNAQAAERNAIIAHENAREAQRNRIEAEANAAAAAAAEAVAELSLSNQLAGQAGDVGATGSFRIALLLGVEALRAADTPATRQIVWNLLANRPEVQTHLFADGAAATRVALSPDGQTLVSSDSNGHLNIWSELASSAPISSTLTAASNPTQVLAIGPDAKLLAAGASDGRIELWDREQGSTRVLNGHSGPVSALAFSPTGALLASADSNGTTLLWRLGASGVDPVPILIAEGAGPVTALAFGPDATVPPTLADGEIGGRVTVWTNLDTPQPAKEELAIEMPTGAVPAVGDGPPGFEVPSPPRSVASLAFDHGGARLAVGFDDGHFVVWDRALGAPAFDPVDAGDYPATSLAFSKNDDMLTVQFADGSLNRYLMADLLAGSGSRQSFTLPVSGASSGALSGEGSGWAVGLDTGDVMLGSLNRPQPPDPTAGRDALIAQACRIANRNLDEADWNAYMGEGVPLRKTCP